MLSMRPQDLVSLRWDIDAPRFVLEIAIDEEAE
jgi:hypothetical protein